MIDDVYQSALAAVRHHLDEAGASYSLDDGEIVLNGHRLGLSIAFDGFVPQGELILAPLDIQIHLDGDTGDRFRVGTLGVGADQATAVREAIAEWHLLAVAPLLAALGAAVDTRRGAKQPPRVGDWDLFAGRVGIRGQVPPILRGSNAFFTNLVERLRSVVVRWDTPNRFQLRSIYFMATCTPEGVDVEAAIDGLVSPELAQLLTGMAWPRGNETYLYKQLFVLRTAPAS